MFCLFTDPIINNRICIWWANLMNLHSLLLLNRVSLYSFPLSYNLPEGFSFRSLRYMIFYFLKELVASLSQIRLVYLLTSCVVIKLSFFCPPESLWLLFFTRVNFRFPIFCFAAKFALAFPSFSLSVSAFSFLCFGSAKVETFFYFPKLFFLFFILSFDRLSFPFLFLLSGLQRCETFFEIRNFIWSFFGFIFCLSISLISLQKPLQ